MTKREAIEKTIKVWTYIRDHEPVTYGGCLDILVTKKRAYKALDLDEDRLNCPCCEFAHKHEVNNVCVNCPLWPSKVNYGCEHNSESPYKLWKDSSGKQGAAEMVELAKAKLKELDNMEMPKLEKGQIWVSVDGEIELEVLGSIRGDYAEVKFLKSNIDPWGAGKVWDSFCVVNGGIGFKLKENQMNLQQLEVKYAELGAEIERLKKVEQAKNWPQIEDTFWVIDRGNICSFKWFDNEVDKFLKSIGNIFRTQQEAEKQLEALKVIAELRAQPGRKKFVVGERNYRLRVRFDCMDIIVQPNDGYDEGWQSIYFKSEQAAMEAIKAVGEQQILTAAKWLAMGE